MLTLEETKHQLPLTDKDVFIDLFLESDICEDYISWLNNPQVVKYSNQRFKNHTADSCRDYWQSLQISDALFLSIKNQKKLLLGTMTVYFNRHHQTADIGLMISPQHWGSGLGTKAWKLLLAFLLNTIGVRKVTGGTLSGNRGMISIMQKAGMESDGVRIAQEIVDNRAYDIVYFAAFREASDVD